MIGARHDWENSNSLRSYPLEYLTNPVANTGYVLPSSILTDCMVVIQSDGINPFLSSINFSSNLITVIFCDQSSGAELFMAQTSFSSVYGTSEIIDLTDYGIVGRVSFGDMTFHKQMAYSGFHSFVVQTNTLSNHCYMCSGDRVVTSISANLGDMTGDITFRARGDLTASVNTQTINGVPYNMVTLGLSDLEKYLPLCVPKEEICNCEFQLIKQINRVYPDELGNIEIEADGIDVIINVIDNIITISVEGTSEEFCPPQNLPSEDGNLPSENSLI
jgi:hypothetical protein